VNEQPQFEPGSTAAIEPEAQPVRPFWRFLIATIYCVVANWIAVSLAFATLSRHPLVADAAYRLLGCVLLVAGFHFMLRIFDVVDENHAQALGLPLNRTAVRQALLGFGIGAVLILMAVGAIAVYGELTVSVHVSAHTLRLGFEVFLLLAFGAMLEELMFRGYPFQRLAESIGSAGAILVFSALFGAVHLWNPNAGGFLSWGFFNTIAVGVLFAVAYLRTGSLWLPFGMHFAWNFFLGVVFGLPVSGLRDFSVIVRTIASGPRILTGGGYGIEASLTGAVVILLGFVPVIVLTRKQPQRI